MVRWAVLLVGMSLVGCASNAQVMRATVAKRAGFDLGCEKYQLTFLSKRTYGVRGCGRRATYLVEGPCSSTNDSCWAVMNIDTPVEDSQ